MSALDESADEMRCSESSATKQTVSRRRRGWSSSYSLSSADSIYLRRVEVESGEKLLLLSHISCNVRLASKNVVRTGPVRAVNWWQDRRAARCGSCGVHQTATFTPAKLCEGAETVLGRETGRHTSRRRCGVDTRQETVTWVENNAGSSLLRRPFDRLSVGDRVGRM